MKSSSAMKKHPFALAALALCAGAPLAAQAAPTVSFVAPAAGATISEEIFQTSACEVTGKRIDRVTFSMRRSGASSWTTLNSDSRSPWRCNIDPADFASGDYTLRAVARDSSGASTTATRSIKIGSGGSVNAAPALSIVKPDAGATISAPLNGSGCEASASDADGSVSKVDFTLSNGSGSTAVGSPTTPPYQCAIDTTKFSDGSYTLMAVATDNLGATTSSQRNVTISKTTSGGDSGGATSPVAAADILTRASADTPFSTQDGYTAQVINTYTSASSIPESGIHGSTLANGETLRLGKLADPKDPARKALAFQVHKNDPLTSKGHRAELSVTPNIELNKTYWVAYSVYVYDWGTLASGDDGSFGSQLHCGDNGAGVGGPSWAINTTRNAGGRTFQVVTRYNPTVNPSGSANTVTTRSQSFAIPFGRWADFVIKFKHNINGDGFIQVWMDGEQIYSYQGSLGYDTGQKDYAKFGYYNWATTMGSTARKVLLRSPTIVRDPTGSTYTQAQLRSLINASAAQ